MDHTGHVSLDGRLVLKRILKIEHENTDLIHLAQNRVQWLAVVNTVVNLRAERERR
jgi:hypothetical protein